MQYHLIDMSIFIEKESFRIFLQKVFCDLLGEKRGIDDPFLAFRQSNKILVGGFELLENLG